MNDRRVDAEVEKMVGYAPERSPAGLRLPRAKAAQLHAALHELLRWRVVPMPTLAAVVGVWVWGAILRRPLLAIPFHLFQQLERHEGETLALWPL
eukprot:2305951-Lingulodinium_polyedra.AAC.1